MKRIILILLFLSFSHSYTLADLNSSLSDTLKNENNYPSHSIQFYLINGVVASYKYNSSEKCSWRISIDLSAMLSGQDEKSKYRNKDYHSGNITQYEREDSWDSQYFESSIQYLHKIIKFEDIEFYFGAGVLFEYNRYFRYGDYYRYENNQIVSKSYAENCEREYGAGIIGIIGVECIINSRFSVFGEYLPNYVYGWHDNSRDATYNYSEEKGNYWRFSVDKFKIGISVNF
jgi:hypothetical protein